MLKSVRIEGEGRLDEVHALNARQCPSYWARVGHVSVSWARPLETYKGERCANCRGIKQTAIAYVATTSHVTVFIFKLHSTNNVEQYKAVLISKL